MTELFHTVQQAETAADKLISPAAVWLQTLVPEGSESSQDIPADKQIPHGFPAAFDSSSSGAIPILHPDFTCLTPHDVMDGTTALKGILWGER